MFADRCHPHLFYLRAGGALHGQIQGVEKQPAALKVVVCHPGKQHVNALLTALDDRGVLVRFRTMFAANKVPGLRFFPKKWREKLRKFYFKDVDEARIGHFPVLFFLLKIMPSEYWSVRLPYRLFDLWTAGQMQKADFDIVIGYENTTLATFTAAKKARKITVLDLAGLHHGFQVPILTAVGAYTDLRAVDFISKKKEAALAVTDHVLVLSKLGERSLVAAGFPPERIHRTSLGVNHSVFSQKKEYRTSGGALELYFVGTLSRLKGLPFALEMVKNLRGRGLDIRLTLIGSVDDFPAPNGGDASFCRHIPFIGHADLAALHRELDLFIFPSNTDSWGMAVVEAMACGSPVLVSANTGAQDAVAQGGGLVLPVGDMDAWLAAVEKFYHDRFLLKKIGEAAAVVAQQYTWEAYHEQVFEAMEHIFKKSVPSSPILQ